ncbi:MAG TPA: transcription repressor NadR [Actinomycetota bacterium]
MLRTEDRRRALVARLRRTSHPVRGSDLAAELGVSRQVVVNDVAILRAGGLPVVGTPQGYLLVDRGVAADEAVVAVRHGRERTAEELAVLVDHGLTVLDVVVEHQLYGEMRANLMLRTREDVDRFVESMERDGAQLLSALTGGVHLHTVRFSDEAALEAARRELRRLGLLLQESG